MPHDTSPSCGAASSECDAHEKLRLVLVALDRAWKRGGDRNHSPAPRYGSGYRRHEVLRAPPRVSDLGRNVEDQQVDIDANPGHKATAYWPSATPASTSTPASRLLRRRRCRPAGCWSRR